MTLADLARRLRASANQLLGRASKEKTSPKTARLLKRFQVERLSPTDQRVVLKLVDGLLERVRANGRS